MRVVLGFKNVRSHGENRRADGKYILNLKKETAMSTTRAGPARKAVRTFKVNSNSNSAGRDMDFVNYTTGATGTP